MRVAAVDCGTNSFRLLVADASDDGLVPVHREMRIVRLGENVDRTGVLAPGALTRARAALADYGSVIRGLGADRIRLVATSATRDAANRDAFAAIVGETIGVTPEVVSGVEEATLSFTGAVDTLPEVKGPVLLADLGGGSTELVLGGGKYQRLRAYSMDMGSVRLTERHLHDDPPTFGQVVVTVADVRVSLEIASEHVPLDTGATLVGVAGTITTLAAIALGLEEYDSAAIHGSRLSAQQVAEITDELILLDHAGRAAIPAIHPGRVDVIVAGALILRTIMEATGAADIVVSEHDILDGIALSLLS
ncbi:Ppx/GppA phosphatase family protein [Jatrophihabitans sp.]|uniref:Ppx/GppA phosphatase family protein n=1 Tax=Jatrophihabitans sp. TaxID=1932789 RepID=UPI0030C782BD|nr:exopolyphosphatase [Jatrophihabitans sp.]